jgi:hypothetical protein
MIPQRDAFSSPGPSGADMPAAAQQVRETLKLAAWVVAIKWCGSKRTRQAP